MRDSCCAIPIQSKTTITIKLDSVSSLYETGRLGKTPGS